MATALVLILLLLVVIGWLKLRGRVNSLHGSVQHERTTLQQQIDKLAARVVNLEQQVEALQNQPSGAAAQPEHAPEAPPRLFVQPPAPAITSIGAPVQQKTAPALPPLTTAFAKPSLAGRLRRMLGDTEWETLVAGSVMNKLGALILVIGIALFLGYSFKLVNPAIRAATAALVSIGILAGGIVMERRPQYRLFSRGLIGAGWAAVYLTVYAMYALPAARIISSPFAGSVLLLAAGAAMVAHSLRYRAQAVTAVAYFSAFAALAATPSTPFAVASLVPLAASLLYFAWRFKWYAMALSGLLATWATCISRGSSNAPLYASSALFIIYWLLFESFDILRSHRGSQKAGLTWIFPLNAIAFLGLLYRAWFTFAPEKMWQMAAFASLLFFASALLRISFRPAGREAASRDPFDCIRKGTYEAPMAIAAFLAGLAIFGRTAGFWTNIGLAFEAEILYLAGVRFRSRFLRALGLCGFAFSLGDLFATASGEPGTLMLFGSPVHNWVPPAAVHVCLFYLNRFVWRTTTVFSYAASGLLALVVVSELGPHAAPVALFGFALLLFELALRKNLRDFRIQSYLLALTAGTLDLGARGLAPHAQPSIWATSAVSALGCWLFTARVLFPGPGELSRQEAARVRDLFAAAGSGFALLTLWMVFPGSLTAAIWTVLALAFLAAASRWNLHSFCWLGAGILGAAYIRTLCVNLTGLWAAQSFGERLFIPVFVIAAFYVAWHRFRRAPEPLQQSFAPVFTWFAVLPALWLPSLEINRFYVASAWAALAIVLLIAGLHVDDASFRRQSYCVTVLSAIWCVLTNFAESGTANIVARILGSSLVIALLFTAEFLLPRNADGLGSREKYARAFFSISATLLLISLLYHEVSGGLLTVAWGLQALACLGFGFLARERILRLQGLAVFGLCILKLFVYDLRNLETVYRILSFTALGVILLGVSWIYTRFRAQIRRYL